jgi:hypothetical protein
MVQAGYRKLLHPNQLGELLERLRNLNGDAHRSTYQGVEKRQQVI